MKKIIIASVILLSVAVSANADLNLLGQGTSKHGTYNLIYDTDLDITWYDYTFSAGPTGDIWQNQVGWAAALSVTTAANTYDDWRLPATVDGPYSNGYDGTTTGGYNITSSEMGHLFYEELGNTGFLDISGNETGCFSSSTNWSCMTKQGDFQNLQHGPYWSGTQYAISTQPNYGPGPEPISSILFIVGGGVIVGIRLLRQNA